MHIKDVYISVIRDFSIAWLFLTLMQTEIQKYQYDVIYLYLPAFSSKFVGFPSH